MTKGEGMTPEEYIAKLEEEVEQRKEYQQRSQSADGEQIERLLGEKYKLEEENKKLKIENAKLKDRIITDENFEEKLDKKNKNLKKELELVRKNTRANVETLDNMYGELVDLKKENKELQKDLEHRDSFFSIMRDVLANEDIDDQQLAWILYSVVHEECGDYNLGKTELEIAKKFWDRKYV